MSIAYFVGCNGRAVIGRQMVDFRAMDLHRALGPDPFFVFTTKVCRGATACVWMIPGSEEA